MFYHHPILNYCAPEDIVHSVIPEKTPETDGVSPDTAPMWVATVCFLYAMGIMEASLTA